MIQTLEAVFDGEGVLPRELMALEPNTRVRIVVETLPEADAEPVSFLRAARSLKLKGPVCEAADEGCELGAQKSDA